jgi:hypothetical protein
MAAVSAQGTMDWVLMRRLKSSCRRSMVFDVRIDFHWPGGKRVKVNSLSPASSRLSATAQQEGLAPRFDLLPRRGVDHVAIVVGDFVVRALGRVREQILVLVHRAALGRRFGPQRASAFSRPGAPSAMPTPVSSIRA